MIKMRIGLLLIKLLIFEFSHTKTPPDFTSRSSSYSAFRCLACFMMLSYAFSRFADSCFFRTNASFNCFTTVARLFIIYMSSGTTSFFGFSKRTPFTSRQHLRSSSSFEMESKTSLQLTKQLTSFPCAHPQAPWLCWEGSTTPVAAPSSVLQLLVLFLLETRPWQAYLLPLFKLLLS